MTESKSEALEYFLKLGLLTLLSSLITGDSLKYLSPTSIIGLLFSSDLDSVKGGLGSFIVSTNQGLMTDRDAKAKNVGGEILCEVF